jgi:adenylate cyclase
MFKSISSLGVHAKLIFGLSGILGLIVGLLFYFIFQRPSLMTFDFVQQFNFQKSQNEVALIVLDQKSLDSLQAEGVVFPLPRQIFGAVAQVAAKLQAKALAFDILFTEDSSYGVDDDKTFAEMLAQSKVPAFFPAASNKGTVKNPIQSVVQVAAALGRVDFDNDSDGTFRRVPAKLQNDLTLPAAVAEHFSATAAESSQDILRNYEQSAYSVHSVYELLKYYRDLEDGKASSVDLSALKNKIWVIGYTAPGLYDLKPMSHDKKAPGMLIVANAISNRLTNTGLALAKAEIYFLILLILVLLTIFSMNIVNEPFSASIWLAAQALFFPVILTVVSWNLGYWFDPLSLSLALLTAGGVMLIWNFRTAWNERLKLAKSLKHAMSEEMVDLIRTGEVQVSRFGEERDVTVLFSDLAGFTTLSEKSTPAQMVNILNAYLDEVVGLITQHSGYIDKFIGDAVMVIWGAPIKQNDHAQRAFEAAAKFNAICEAFNDKMLKENPNFERLVTRVGLHTGKAIVGNIGATKRHNYTAIGDTVNQASRLEGIGKNYDVCLTLSEDVVKAVQAEKRPDLLELDQIILKGKTQATRLFTLVSDTQTQDAEIYKIALQYYYKAQWQQALTEFNKIKKIPAALMMKKRCELALEKGNLNNWINGAWMYDSK